MTHKENPASPRMTFPPAPVRAVLSPADIAHEFGVGEHLARKLTEMLPNATFGRSRIVRRADVEKFLDRVIANNGDVGEYLSTMKRSEILGWLSRPV